MFCNFHSFHSNKNKNDPFAQILGHSKYTHHPNCPKWNHHFIKFFGVPLCLGCTCASIGFLFGSYIVWLLFQFNIHPLYIWIVGLFLVVPSIIQIFWHPYVYKIIARFLLGFAIIFMFGSTIFGFSLNTEGLLLRILLILLFVIAYTLVQKLRSKYQNDPCFRCKEGVYPFCNSQLEKLKSVRQKLSCIPNNDKKGKELLNVLNILLDQMEGKENNTKVEIIKISLP